ncbi:hypothetical protein LG413_13815, partial [Acetobacter persici]|nr:hypothetical protein [Acetobacter persici]
MRTSPKKARLSVYLEPKLLDALTAHATRRDLSLSLVAEAAIASFLSPDADERREAAMSRRLDRLDRQVARMERDLGISLETLALNCPGFCGDRTTREVRRIHEQQIEAF